MKKTLLILLLLIAAKADAQMTFSKLNTGTKTELKGIAAADTNTVFACGDTGIIIKTTNGGTSWAKLTTGTTNPLWDIKIVPGSSGQQIVAVGDNNTILKSTNGGTSWTMQTPPTPANTFIFGIYCVDANTYYACGGSIATSSAIVLKTTNGGSSWTLTNVSAAFFLDKIFAQGSSIYTVGTGSLSGDGVILKGNGTTYTSSKSAPAVVSNLWCIDANRVIGVSTNGSIWRTTDGGSTWTDKSPSFFGELFGIKFRNNAEGFVCGVLSGNTAILRTTDTGITWTNIAVADTIGLLAIEIAGNKVYTCGEYGTVMKSTISNTNSIQHTAIATKKIYPNPATDIITIDGGNAQQTTIYNIIDGTGRLIMTGSITGTGSLNISALASGNYTISFSEDAAVYQFTKR